MVDASTPSAHVRASLPARFVHGTLFSVATSLTRAPRPMLEQHAHTPSWARWNSGLDCWYAIGVEEELMLLDPIDYSLAECSRAVLARLPAALRSHFSPEIHAAVLELKTGIHTTVSGAAVELAALRLALVRELARTGLAAACGATHPVAGQSQTPLSRGARYGMIGDSMRSLAQREPTMGLHVHVGVPDPDNAIRVLGRLRENVPVLLALSANSPFLHGRDSGFCSTRTTVFDGFPRTGPPRAYAHYDEYVTAVDDLVSFDAVPDPTFLWWDVRPQPALGTVEVRVMDVQTDPRDTAALAALIQSLARCELEGSPLDVPSSPEVLEENRFIAARDGLDARLIDPRRRRRVPVRTLVRELVEECEPHAASLGCVAQLGELTRLAAHGGADRQRAWAAAGGIESIIRTLADQFAISGRLPLDRPERSK
jgi:carboxylate-amine ligase